MSEDALRWATPEQAWAAGLFEGEGCIHITRNKYRSVALTVVSTDFDVVRRFAKIVKVGTISGPFHPNGNTRWKPVLKWQCSHQHEMSELLTWMRSLLGDRRGAKADEALEAFASYARRNPTLQRHKEATQ